MKIINKVALAVFKDKKILLTRESKNKDAFYMLGGRMEPGESEEETLKREVAEEVECQITEGSLQFLAEFEAPAHGIENTLVNIKLYTGELNGTPTPCSEIEELRYFDSTIDAKHLTPVSDDIMKWLKTNNYIS